MQNLSQREASFTKQWPHSRRLKCNPTNLAKAGFYSTPSIQHLDTTTCYLCHIIIDQWDPKQDPILKHATMNPECPIVVLNSGKQWMKDTLEGKTSTSDNGPHSTTQQAARQATFQSWPHSPPHTCTPESMSMGGFIFQPEKDSEDRAECMYCNLGLDGFESNDSPLEEHEKRSAKCFFFKKQVKTGNDKVEVKSITAKKLKAITKKTKAKKNVIIDDEVMDDSVIMPNTTIHSQDNSIITTVDDTSSILSNRTSSTSIVSNLVGDEDQEDFDTTTDTIATHQDTTIIEKDRELSILNELNLNEGYTIEERDYDLTVGELLKKMIEEHRSSMYAEGKSMIDKFEASFDQHQRNLQLE